MVITVACNGRKPTSVSAGAGTATLVPMDKETGLCKIELKHDKSEVIDWAITF